jgi:hypothetical protein
MLTFKLQDKVLGSSLPLGGMSCAVEKVVEKEFLAFAEVNESNSKLIDGSSSNISKIELAIDPLEYLLEIQIRK